MAQIAALKGRISRIIIESFQEMKMVVWPGRREVVRHTLIVIIFSLVLAAFLGGLDLLFSQGLQKLLGIVKQ